MSRAKRLTDFEKGQIVALLSSGLSSGVVTKKIGSFETGLNYFLNLKDNYGKWSTGGSPIRLYQTWKNLF